jgi:hypothetical protein
MKFGVIRCPTANPAQSPFRIIERTTKHEVEWANRFLDRECLRRVTNATLYGYAYHLLHFIRWWVSVQHTDVITESALTESTLLDYLRFQSSQQPPFSGSTINERVAVADRALRVPSRSRPGSERFSGNLLATGTDGSRPASACTNPLTGPNAETHHRAAVGG